MNLLIIGGLLIVAAAAIIGAILLGINEQRTEATRSISVKPSPSTESSQLVTRKLEDEPVLVRPNAPAREEEQRLPSLNGQFHELAGEIRTLHQQAWQLEQRLSILTEMVDHIENTQGDHLSFQEGSHPTSDNTLV
ncbi:MAG: hypothetical protein JOZ18_10515 [Chloroflexi bacterium]|nr:hypothetical protein [Chloroflexota bacterium]